MPGWLWSLLEPLPNTMIALNIPALWMLVLDCMGSSNMKYAVCCCWAQSYHPYLFSPMISLKKPTSFMVVCHKATQPAGQQLRRELRCACSMGCSWLDTCMGVEQLACCYGCKQQRQAGHTTCCCHPLLQGHLEEFLELLAVYYSLYVRLQVMDALLQVLLQRQQLVSLHDDMHEAPYFCGLWCLYLR